MKKVFLDTNILISFLDSSRENHYLVKSLFVKLKNSDTKMIFSIPTNIFYNLKNNRLEAVNFIRIVNSSKYFEIVGFGRDTIEKATSYYLSKNDLSNKNDFEDILQYFCALKNSCKVIYTDDKSNFPRLEIPLISSSNEIFYKS